MSQNRRLETGGRIDRSTLLEFAFNGERYKGFRGDTLASALLANGVDKVGRSFKYYRHRGIVGSGAEEPNAIVQLESNGISTPNLRATEVELVEGLSARSVTDTDRMGIRRIASRFTSLMPVGFYYKTLLRPKAIWNVGEKLIRQAAGLGTVSSNSDPDIYDKYHHHCDVLVVGAGAAGLTAALAAAELGLRVILADEQSEFGGWLLSTSRELDAAPAVTWIDQVVASLRARPNVNLLLRTTIFGLYDHSLALGCERLTGCTTSTHGVPRERLHQIRAQQVVLATGALERPLTFANNDLPGIMLPSAVLTYLNRYAVAVGAELVLATTNDQAYEAAFAWHDVGLKVVAICDMRSDIPLELVSACDTREIPVMREHTVMEARGSKRVEEATVVPLSVDKRNIAGKGHKLTCDVLATSTGWNPVIHLNAHTRTMARWDEKEVSFLLDSQSPDVATAGAINGSRTLVACMREGVAAIQKLRSLVDAEIEFPLPQIDETNPTRCAKFFKAPHPRLDSRAPKQFVDFQLDVTVADIQLAVREGYRTIEHVKRYTALGFGNDQGKLGNVNGINVLADATGTSMRDIGTTVFRPPYTPVTFGAIAGRSVGGLFDPERHTPMHQWHVDHGAEWENVGQWKRPWFYPIAGESMQDAVNREVLAARNDVAVLDASTLGKIDVQGRDAAVFIDRMYSNTFANLSVGRCRYGLMLRDTGVIFDDGVTARLDKDHFLVHTTTGNAEPVLSWLELWHHTEWPELDVRLTSVTDQWATVAVVGPKSRQVLGKLCPELNFSNESFPFMSVQTVQIGQTEARIFRVSFSGELSYEINVPAQYGLSLWARVIEIGEPFGITPYGTETMHVLRAEKGFIIAGQDTDGSMTPADMNLSWCVRKTNDVDFVGRRSLKISDYQRTDRLQLVGLETRDPLSVLPEGGQLLNEPIKRQPAAMQGFVTSAYFSATLDRSIALAMVKGGLQRKGDTLHCALYDGSFVEANVVSSVFFDPDNLAQKVDFESDTFEVKPSELGLSSPVGTVRNTSDEASGRDAGVTLRAWRRYRIFTLVGSTVDDRDLSGRAGFSEFLPLEPCTWKSVDNAKFCWLGPSRWLMLERFDEEEYEPLELPSDVVSYVGLIDTTGAYAVFSLSGTSANELLKKSCAFDFHESVFSSQSCVQSTFAKASALVVAREDGGVDLVVRRSFADYVVRWIEDASEEFGFRHNL